MHGKWLCKRINYITKFTFSEDELSSIEICIEGYFSLLAVHIKMETIHPYMAKVFTNYFVSMCLRKRTTSYLKWDMSSHSFFSTAQFVTAFLAFLKLRKLRIWYGISKWIIYFSLANQSEISIGSLKMNFIRFWMQETYSIFKLLLRLSV